MGLLASLKQEKGIPQRNSSQKSAEASGPKKELGLLAQLKETRQSNSWGDNEVTTPRLSAEVKVDDKANEWGAETADAPIENDQWSKKKSPEP